MSLYTFSCFFLTVCGALQNDSSSSFEDLMVGNNDNETFFHMMSTNGLPGDLSTIDVESSTSSSLPHPRLNVEASYTTPSSNNDVMSPPTLRRARGRNLPDRIETFQDLSPQENSRFGRFAFDNVSSSVSIHNISQLVALEDDMSISQALYDEDQLSSSSLLPLRRTFEETSLMTPPSHNEVMSPPTLRRARGRNLPDRIETFQDLSPQENSRFEDLFYETDTNSDSIHDMSQNLPLEIQQALNQEDQSSSSLFPRNIFPETSLMTPPSHNEVRSPPALQLMRQQNFRDTFETFNTLNLHGNSMELDENSNEME